MSVYRAPIPPVAPPHVATPRVARGPRVGGYDAHGTPQDTLAESRTAPVHRRSPRPPWSARWGAGPVGARRSLLIAVVLAALLGPIGLLYSSKTGALLTSALFFVLALPLVAVWWQWIFVAAALTAPVCVTWAFVATLGRNAVSLLRRRIVVAHLR